MKYAQENNKQGTIIYQPQAYKNSFPFFKSDYI